MDSGKDTETKVCAVHKILLENHYDVLMVEAGARKVCTGSVECIGNLNRRRGQKANHRFSISHFERYDFFMLTWANFSLFYRNLMRTWQCIIHIFWTTQVLVKWRC